MTPDKMQEIRAALPFLFAGALVTGSGAWILLRARWSPLAPDREEPREPPLWGPVDVVAVFAAWFVVPTLLVVAMIGLGLKRDPLLEMVLSGFAQLVVCGLTFYLVMGRLGQPPSTLGLVWPLPPQLVGTVLLYILVLMPFFLVGAVWQLFLHDGLGLEIQPQELVQLAQEKLKERDTVYIAALAFLSICIAPFVEEVVFRGFLFGWLRARWGGTPAAVISSVIFAALHKSPAAFASLVFLALVLCALYTRTRSIFPCMLYHAFVNAQTVVILLVMGPEAGEAL